MGTTFFGSATTILLGLKGYSSFSSHAEGLSVAALISSAAVTLDATWETFFDHRWLLGPLHRRFRAVNRNFRRPRICSGQGSFSDDQVDLYYDRLKATLQESRSAWFEKRAREIGTDR
jgi:hypothetical protein